MDEQLRVRTMGGLYIDRDNSPVTGFISKKAKALLCYLAVTHQPHSRDSLAELLWGGIRDDSAKKNLRNVLSNLRQLVGPYLDITRDTVTFNQKSPYWLDVDALTREVQDASMVSQEMDVKRLEDAVELYRGDFLTGFSIHDAPRFEEWVRYHAEQLKNLAAKALVILSKHYTAQGDYGKAIFYIDRLLALDPLREEIYRQKMVLLVHSGQREAALAQFKTYRDILAEELDTEPSQEMETLYRQIQAGIYQFDVTPFTYASPNVMPMHEAETHEQLLVNQPQAHHGSAPLAPDFLIGREDAVRDVKQRLGITTYLQPSPSRQPVTIIRGWPGVGKTALAAYLAHDKDVIAGFPDGVLWASLGPNPDDLLSELAAWGRALGADEIADARTIREASARLTALLRDQSRLLIIDDIWSIEDALPFKVGGYRCATLITTRPTGVAEVLAPTPADIFWLRELTEDKALELLTKLAPSVVAKYPEESRELVLALEGLPLAIQVAGRLLRVEEQRGFEIPALLAELHAGSTLLKAKAPPDMVDLTSQTTPTVAALLKKSTDHLDPQMRDCFAFLGAFAPKPATFDMIAMSSVWQVQNPKPIVQELVDRGLLEFVGDGRYQMHALLVLLAKSLLTED